MSLKTRLGGLFPSWFNTNPNTFRGGTGYIGSAPVAQPVWIDDNIDAYISQGYSMNDVVYSIGHITSEKIKVAPWGVYKVKDESSLKSLQREQRKKPEERNNRLELDLRTKALESYSGDGRLSELLQWPNENETFSDMVAHSSIAKMMMGNRYVQARLLDGGANGGKPYELWLPPAQYIQIKSNREYPVKTMGYQLTIDGNPIPITKEELLHDKYYNPAYSSSGTHLYGMAPLKAALHTLTNDNSALESSTISFQNMGPGMVGWLDDERISGDMSVQQISAFKTKWHEENTGAKASKKLVLSGYKMGFKEMGLSPVDLAILEQQKWNLIKFCNIWNFPHLMLLSDHATDNNVGWAERALTQRCAMPLLTSFRDNFNRKLQTDWGYKGQNIYIDFDQSVYSELDVDRKDATDWIARSYWLPERMKFELQNLEIPEYLSEEFLNSAHIPQGLVNSNDIDMPGLNDEV